MKGVKKLSLPKPAGKENKVIERASSMTNIKVEQTTIPKGEALSRYFNKNELNKEKKVQNQINILDT